MVVFWQQRGALNYTIVKSLNLRERESSCGELLGTDNFLYESEDGLRK